MARKIESQLGRDYFWNTASSIVGSASMVVMLLVVTQVVGVYVAGIFSLATAVGQQFQTLGAYEVRPYQASDVRHRFAFGTYYATRIVTVTLMFVGIVVYASVGNRSVSQALTLVLVASLRLFDAFEDVFYGEFQRVGRLDVAGRANFFRVLVTLLSFSISVVITRNLLLSTVITIVLSLIAMVALIFPPAHKMFGLRPVFSFGKIKDLLVVCLPLALAAFLSMYLTNAPRFAIETYFPTNDYQGYYNILFMPALAINILAMFIFRPLLTRMATKWTSNDWPGFIKLVVRGIQGVFAAFIVTFAGAYFLGIPILNLLSGFDLAQYRRELLILVMGGAFNALSVILYYALTTLRRQRSVFVGYSIAAVAVYFVSNALVSRLGMLGAAISYSVVMIGLTVIFGVLLGYYTRQERARSARQ